MTRARDGAAVQPRVLVLEQARAPSGMMCEAFMAAGYEVAEALSLSELEDLIQGFEPNVIVVEMNLEGEQGDEVCRKVKARSVKLTPVVLVSSMAEPELTLRAKQAGADRHHRQQNGLARLVELIGGLTAEIIY